jgi:hypothetical protein
VAEAAQADIVFISAHAQGVLSQEVKDWIRRWLARKNRHCSTLVSLLDGPSAPSIEGSAIHAYLRRVADRACLSFFSHGSVQQKKGHGPVTATLLEKSIFRSPMEEEILSEQTGFSC